MKLAIIPPKEHLALGDIGDIAFALAHFALEDPEYIEYYREKAKAGMHVILDNGAFELGKSIRPGELLDVAEDMMATEVIAPDVLWKPQDTFDDSLQFMNFLEDNDFRKNWKIMSVVWAKGPHDYLKWFGKHYNEIKPDRYGIGKWLENSYPLGTRMHTIYQIQKEYGLPPEKFHALGCPYPMEVHLMRDLVWSMDTGLAAKAALSETLLLPNRTVKVPTMELGPMSFVQLSMATRNAEMLMDLASGKVQIV